MHKQGALREFGHYAAMNILGMIGISCYILADTYFVAQGLGSLGLAALNIAIPAYNLMNGIGLMLGVGLGVIHRAVALHIGHEIQVIAGLRLQDRLNRIASRIENRAGRQTFDAVGVIRGIKVRIDLARHPVVVFFLIYRIAHGDARLQLHAGGQTVVEHARDQLHIARLGRFILNNRSQRKQLVHAQLRLRELIRKLIVNLQRLIQYLAGNLIGVGVDKEIVGFRKQIAF